MTKTILTLAVIASFIAGASMISLMSTSADAAQEDKPDPVADAIDRLTEAVQEIPAIAGPEGEQGEQGEQGPSPSPYIVRIIDQDPNTDIATANCNPGDIATGGGGFANSPLTGIFPINSLGSGANDGETPVGYSVTASANGRVDAWAICFTP